MASTLPPSPPATPPPIPLFSAATPVPKLAAGLYVVATPLGNMRDISLRALDVLAAADIIYCEDTRIAAKLCHAYGLSTPRQSYHEHNGARMRPKIIAQLAAGKALALISDAGTPTISDPGFPLVRAVRAAGHQVFAVPGASAAIAALSIAGLPTDRFCFLGFLPRTSSARRKALGEVATLRATLVLYESARRVSALLDDIEATLAGRDVCIARELTKKFETVLTGTPQELAAHSRATPLKGEIVVLISPPAPQTPADVEAALDDATIKAALAGASVRDAVRALCAQTGLPRKAIYARALALRKNDMQDSGA